MFNIYVIYFVFKYYVKKKKIHVTTKIYLTTCYNPFLFALKTEKLNNTCMFIIFSCGT